MKKIETSTIIRTVVLALALVNQILATLGKSPIPVEEETITLLISTSVTVVTAVWAWWKNNSFTQAALEADEVLKNKKSK